jgi:hypothetical protein
MEKSNPGDIGSRSLQEKIRQVRKSSMGERNQPREKAFCILTGRLRPGDETPGSRRLEINL